MKRRSVLVGAICFLLGATMAALAATAIRPEQFVALAWSWTATQTFDAVHKITGLPTPSSSSDAATKDYVDSQIIASGSGTVTSVGISVPASSIFGTSGSPVTTTGTLGITIAGTSGGIPYFDTTSTLSSSAALTNHALVLGGGAGAAPTALGSLGSSSTLLHGAAAGAPTFGSVVTADITAANITYAKIQNVTAASLLGNPTGGTTAPSEITLGSGLAFSGTTLISTSSGGTVTSITCNGGLTGGVITATGTCALDTTNGNTWSGLQQFNDGDLALKGSSSGTTTLKASATAGSTTIIFPAATDTAAVLGVAQTWTATQSSSPQTLTISTATFTPAAASGNNIKITLVHASCPCTIANPSGTPVAGTSGAMEIIQSSTGSDTVGTWGSQYMAAGGVATLTLSTAANAKDFFSYYVEDSTHILVTTAALNATH